MSMVQGILGIIISISTVLGIFTTIINKLFSHKLKPIESKIDANRLESLKKDAEFYRFEIVTFANELHNNYKFSKSQFEAIIVFIDRYEEIINELQIKNGVFEEERLYIIQKYHELVGIK